MTPNQMRDGITKRVKAALDSGRVTQVELAQMAGLTQSAISMGVSGYRPFNRIDVLDALHKILPRIEKRRAGA